MRNLRGRGPCGVAERSKRSARGEKMEGCGDSGRRESDECDNRDGVVIEKQVFALGGN